MQAVIRLDWPSVGDIKSTIDAIVDAGFKVKISEIDISVYNDYPSGSFDPEAQTDFTQALETKQADADFAINDKNW